MTRAFPCLLALSLTLFTLPAGAAIKVTCVGDSITQGNGASDEYSKSYPGVLRTLLGSGYTVGNYGYGGATLLPYSGSFCYTNTSQFQPGVNSAGDIILFMLGTNDGASEGGCKDHLDEMTNRYDELIAHYTVGRNPAPRIIVATPGWIPIPNPPWVWSGERINNQIAPIVRSYAATRGYQLVDINAVTWGHPEWSSDGMVHFNDAGYQAIGTAFYVAVTNGNVTPVPVATVRGNGNVINDGSSTPAVANHTDFGATPVSTGAVQRVFRIHNDGTADLQLTGNPLVAVSGSAAADFTLITPPGSTTVGAGSYTEFTVRFIPAASGARTATLSIANNDAARTPYDFVVSGTGTVTLVAPAAFTAYNDVAWAVGQPADRITTYGLSEGGPLKAQANGAPLAVQVTMSGVNASAWSGSLNGAAPAGSPAAQALPTNLVDSTYHWYYDSATVTFDGLVATNLYTFVLYANRDASYTDRYTTVTIQGADAFQNNSTVGAADQAAAAATIFTGTGHGNLFRFDRVNPGSDGVVTFALGGYKPCLNAFMVQTPSTGVVVQPPAPSLVAMGDVWKYHNTGASPATNWFAAAIPDGSWSNGAAPLGYDDAAIATPLSYGSDSGNKWVTYYFRKHFTVASVAAVTGLVASYNADDAAVFYLNGRKIHASTNLPAVVDNGTYALSYLVEPYVPQQFTINPAELC